MGKEDSRAKKAVQFKRIYELFSKYQQIIVVRIMNVGSRQVQDIRRLLAKKNSYLLVGKNTLIKRVLQTRAQDLPENHEFHAELAKFGKAIPELDILKNQIESKVGFIFTNEPVFDLKPLVEANKVQTAAKVGATSPVDVTIPPGPTGMDPSQISFFHALQISTKIQKGQIEIVKEFKVCEIGQKVTNSQAALLQKLNIKPFEYGMEVLSCYDSGSILNKQQVSISLSETLKTFQTNASRIAAISLQTGIVTEASVPHLVLTAFKNLAAIGIQTGYEFAQLKGATSGAPAPAPAALTQAPAAKAAAPVKEEEKPEPEEDLDMGGMFDF